MDDRRIFISYRRGHHAVDDLPDLADVVGAVFPVVYDRKVGALTGHWRRRIRDRIDASPLVLVLLTDRTLASLAERDRDGDVMRAEIEAALDRDIALPVYCQTERFGRPQLEAVGLGRLDDIDAVKIESFRADHPSVIELMKVIGTSLAIRAVRNRHDAPTAAEIPALTKPIWSVDIDQPVGVLAHAGRALVLGLAEGELRLTRPDGHVVAAAPQPDGTSAVLTADGTTVVVGSPKQLCLRSVSHRSLGRCVVAPVERGERVVGVWREGELLVVARRAPALVAQVRVDRDGETSGWHGTLASDPASWARVVADRSGWVSVGREGTLCGDGALWQALALLGTDGWLDLDRAGNGHPGAEGDVVVGLRRRSGGHGELVLVSRSDGRWGAARIGVPYATAVHVARLGRGAPIVALASEGRLDAHAWDSLAELAREVG